MGKSQVFCESSLTRLGKSVYDRRKSNDKEGSFMKHIQTLNTRDMAKSVMNGGCGECQTSCQSACKTSCGIANQACEKASEK